MIIKTNNYKKIFSKKNKLRHDLTPKLLNKIEKKNETNISLKQYEYEVYCEVDKRSLIKNDINKILIMATTDGLNTISSKRKMLSGLNKKSIGQINWRISNFESFLRKENIKKKEKAQLTKLGEISIDKVIDSSTRKKSKKLNDSNLFGTYRKFEVSRKKLEPKSRLRKTETFTSERTLGGINEKDSALQKQKTKDDTESNQSIFKRRFLNYQNAGIDPMTYVQDFRENPQNFLENIKGALPSNQTKSRAEKNSVYEDMGSMVTRLAKQQVNKTYDGLHINTKNVSKRIDLLSQKITIDDQVVSKLGSNFSIIFIAIDSKGKKLDFYEQKVSHNENIQIQRDQPNLDYLIDANRIKNKSVLKITNNSNKLNTFNVYTKKVGGIALYEFTDFKLDRSGVTIPPKSSMRFYSSVTDSQSLHYRVTSIYQGKEMCNVKSVSSVGTKLELKPTNIGISSKVNANSILIGVRNIPSNIAYVNILRRNLSKKSKTFSPILTKSEGGELIESQMVAQGSSDTLTFVDYDVNPYNVYEYKAKLYTKNLKSYMSSTSAIEEYEIRSGQVLIEISDKRRNSSFIDYELSVKQSDDRINDLLNSLSSDLYTVYKDDLQAVNDVLVSSSVVEVHLQNIDTSENLHVGDFSVDKNGLCKISIPLETKNSYNVKFSPKTLPASYVIDRINEQANNLASNISKGSVDKFSYARSKNNFKNSNVVSAVGTKYSSRLVRDKGKITDEQTSAAMSNRDLYYDGKTGDNIYDDIIGTKRKTKNIELDGKKIKVLKNLESSIERKNNSINSNKFLVEFQSDSDYVDFYVIFYKSNNQITYDGLVIGKKNLTRSKYTNYKNKYSYYSEVMGCLGSLTYYCMPVFKDGSIGTMAKVGYAIVHENFVEV